MLKDREQIIYYYYYLKFKARQEIYSNLSNQLNKSLSSVISII